VMSVYRDTCVVGVQILHMLHPSLLCSTFQERIIIGLNVEIRCQIGALVQDFTE
jgi:hypothetical protein